MLYYTHMIELLVQAKPIIIFLHALAAALAIGATITTDVLFFNFLKDFHISKKEKEVFETISSLLWMALAALIVTGILIFFTDTARYMASSKFIVKMILVVIVTINGLVLNWFVTPHMGELSFNATDDKKNNMTFMRRVSFASGGLSISTWLIIFLLGSVPSIPFAVGQAMLIYLGVIMIVIAGSQLFDYRIRKQYQKISKR